jgi:DNA-binding helix-hairpin-helix protein with protein kinase domain
MRVLEAALQTAQVNLQHRNQQFRKNLQGIQSEAETAARIFQNGSATHRETHAAALAEAEHRVHEAALLDHLGEADIQEAGIPGIGAGRKQTLRNHGIQTAADLREDRLLGLPGFGPGLIRRLMEWRMEVEGEFQFHKLGGHRKHIQQEAAEILRRRGAEARQRIQESIHAARRLKDAQRAEFQSLQDRHHENLLKREVLAIRIEALT